MNRSLAAPSSAPRTKVPGQTRLRVKVTSEQQLLQVFLARVQPWARQMLAEHGDLFMELALAELTLSKQQRGFFHGVVLAEISRQAVLNGHRLGRAGWKESFREAFLNPKVFEVFDVATGQFKVKEVPASTEDLSVKAYSEFIDKVTAFAVTEFGVSFPEFGWQEWDGSGGQP